MTTWLIFVGACFGLSTCSHPAYALPAHPHGESGLVTRTANGTYAASSAAFLCASFGYAPVMARLEGDAFARAGLHLHRLTNPLQSCRPHLVMSGKTSFKQMESDHD
jgi:hypothetical protein